MEARRLTNLDPTVGRSVPLEARAVPDREEFDLVVADPTRGRDRQVTVASDSPLEAGWRRAGGAQPAVERDRRPGNDPRGRRSQDQPVASEDDPVPWRDDDRDLIGSQPDPARDRIIRDARVISKPDARRRELDRRAAEMEVCRDLVAVSEESLLASSATRPHGAVISSVAVGAVSTDGPAAADGVGTVDV